MWVESRVGVATACHLCALREDRGLNQAALALRAGIGPDTVSNVESGSKHPSIATLLALAYGLRLRISTMLAGYETGERDYAAEVADMVASASPKMQRELFNSVCRQLDQSEPLLPGR